jgi:hypothetical protein
MPATHFPDEDKYHAIRPEDVEWKQFPAFPPAVRLAVLVGDPREPGPYVKSDSGKKTFVCPRL